MTRETDNHRTAKSDVRTKFRKAETVLFEWLLPLGFLVGGFWTLDVLENTGSWNETTALAFMAGMMLVIGGQAVITQWAKVIRRVL